VKHLLNFGKYIASLLVVFVSSFLGKTASLVVIVSAIATIYAATWDIGLDWGLKPGDLLCSRASANQNVLNAETDVFSAISTGDQNARNVVDVSTRRHFHPRTYWLAVVFDIVARLTWLQTLMPGGLLTDSIVLREVLLVVSAAVEILRRSIWAVLRIEWEQLSNASKFRTLNWVPTKLNTWSCVSMARYETDAGEALLRDARPTETR
jgi:hypothetical protein